MANGINDFPPQSNPSLEEMAQARPPRGTGAPARVRSHYERILALLKERGPNGVTSVELYEQPQLFGRSPRNRISELRKDGHLIKTIPIGASIVRYVLIHENPSVVERPPAKPAPPKWEDRPKLEGLLFDVGVQP